MDQEGIDDARERLYARREEMRQTRMVPRRGMDPEVPRAWREEPRAETPSSAVPWSRYFLIGSGLFFALAALISGGIFLLGGTVVSPDRIDLTVNGPSVVGGGDEATLSIKITNKNPVALEYAVLSIDLPEGTRNPDNPSENLPRITEDLQNMRPGETRDISVRAVLFAREGTTLTLPISFEYRTEGSNASVVKEKKYDILVSNSPLTLTLEGDTSVVSGDEVTIVAKVRGNSKEPIADAAVLFSYPFGFTVTNTDPSSKDGKFFPLGTLRSGEERTITVRGVMVGAEGENRAIRVATGIGSGDDLKIQYVENTQTVALISPLLQIRVALNSKEAAQHTASPDTLVQGVISWENDLDMRVFDGEIKLIFSGTGLDPASVEVINGFWDKGTNTVSFTRDTSPELATMEPGAKGTLRFTMRTKQAGALSGVERPTVTMALSMLGKVSENRVIRSISSSYSTRVLVTPALAVSASGFYGAGPFLNTGQVPPRVGKETLYTITLTARGGTSSIADLTISGTLPSYVKYMGVKDPSSADISVNELSGEISWKAGEVGAGATRTASFQVGFTPNSSQKGKEITLFQGIVASGFDRFTQASVRQSGGNVTTAITSDPGYQPSWALVTE